MTGLAGGAGGGPTWCRWTDLGLAGVMLAGGLAGCVIRSEIIPDWPDVEPPPARSRGAVGLAVAPGVSASTAEYLNPWDLTRTRVVAPVGTAVVEAWERMLARRFERVERLSGPAPSGLAGVVEISRISALVEREDWTYQVRVEVDATLRGGARSPDDSETFRVVGKDSFVTGTLPAELGEAVSRAVRQAASRFQWNLDHRPAAVAWRGPIEAPPPAPGAAAPQAHPLASEPPASAGPGGPAPPPLPDRAGTRSRILAAVDAGMTGQVDGNPARLAELVLGTLQVQPRFTYGLLGRLGTRDEYLAWAISLAAGHTFEPAGAGQVLLLGELGLNGLLRDGPKAGGLWSPSLSGGDSVLPYLGARILLGLEADRSSLVFGFFVQRTLGTANVTYTSEQCFFSGCTTTTVSARDGGFSGGLTIGWSRPLGGRPP